MTDAASMTPEQMAALAAQLGLNTEQVAQALATVTSPGPSIEEPTDPAARVCDRFGVTWAHVDGAWCSRLGQAPGDGSFAALDQDFGPLEISGS